MEATPTKESEGTRDAAMDGYHRMCAAQDDPDELERIRDDLREYCRLDTLGMVRILEVLENL